MRQVRSGGRRLVEVLSAGFADDPWIRWTIPDAGARRSLFSLFLRTVAFPHGVVLTVGAPPAGVGVLMPPGVALPEDPDVGAMVLALQGPLVGRALDAEAILERARPTEPAWILHTLAVHPTAQGRGLGAAILEAAMARAEDTGQALTLETSNPRARRWYQRRGFVLDASVDLVDHGLGAEAPTVDLLTWRPSREPSTRQGPPPAP